MLQVRIVNFGGGNPVIMDQAADITISDTLNSPDEGVSFTIAKNDPKSDAVNPYMDGYTKFWEVWDTETNERINYGTIEDITDNGSTWQVNGRGRSVLLSDIISSRKTFFQTIDGLVEDLRYENIAIEPRTNTMVHSTASGNPDEDALFGNPIINTNYYGLSKYSKEYAIDDNNGLLRYGETEPPNTYWTAEEFWTGMSTKDTIIVDLGDTYPISRVVLQPAWWGGATRYNNRTYDYYVDYALPSGVTTVNVQNKTFGPWSNIATFVDNRQNVGPTSPINFYLGTTYSGISPTVNTYYTNQDQTGPINMRYLRIGITDVHAWFGTVLDNTPAVDGWAYQCDPNYVPGSIAGISRTAQGVMANDVINDREIEPANDCHASIVEIGALQEIVKRDLVKPLALQRIDNNNMQITYSHTPDATETVTTQDGFRKFEPGSFFRNAQVTWSGANSSYTKFYADDCDTCYPTAFKFGIMDQDNNLIVASTSTSGTNAAVKAGINTSFLLMKGASNATITWCDGWPATYDPLSWGASYSHSEVAGDTATIHFRGESFKWYATVPEGKTGATVRIEIRSKQNLSIDTPATDAAVAAAWNAWQTLETGFKIPDNISATAVYEITYESGTLASDTIYQIRITNLGGFCSIDSIEGYWSASAVSFNEDNTRISLFRPENVEQIYDGRLFGGSAYKTNTRGMFAGFMFTGDRAIILSATGRNHGKVTVWMSRAVGNQTGIYDPGTATTVMIPGGSSVNGSVTINTDTGKKGNESTQYILFDTDEYFPNGLAWGTYFISLNYDQVETYTTDKAEVESRNFRYRCDECRDTAISGVTGSETETINKYIYLDAILVHEKIGVSVSFDNQTNLEQLSSLAELLQCDWDITENGVRLEPRIGQDTNEVLREGQNTLVNYQVVNDASKIASMLFSGGSDIDGLPLFTITEDKKNRAVLGRTVMRQEDFRNVAEYMQLIGLSRMELRKRRYPEQRITVTHIARSLPLDIGDSFILYSKKMGPIRVRITKKEIRESSGGREYSLECTRWPLMS